MNYERVEKTSYSLKIALDILRTLAATKGLFLSITLQKVSMMRTFLLVRLIQVTTQITALLIGLISTAWAAEPINTLEKSGLWSYKPSGIAIRGFDTVAYFTLGKATKGSEQFATQWQGATWYFASQEHLDLFNTEPEKYAPQYGGYCAWGIVVDNLVKIEGDLWDIVDGKLYLNFNKKLQEKWRKDIPGNIKIADEKFERLLKEK